jgi:hypothetical protein
MKFWNNIKTSVRDLIHGRPIVIEQIPVHIEKEEKKEQEIITNRSFISQNGENFIVLPFDNPDLLLEFAEQNPDLIFRYLMKRISKAIRNDLPSVILFQFGKSAKNLAMIHKDKYKIQLDHMMAWFVKEEDYESASVCKTLISQLTATDAIDQTH